MTLTEKMRATLDRWESSGLSLRAFGKREEISYSKLQYWQRKLRGQAGKRMTGAETVELIPAEIVAEASERDRPVIGIWLPNGVAIEAPAGVSEGELSRLV